MSRRDSAYSTRPFPAIRRAYVDVLREGQRRHMIHGLVEVDVTTARERIRAAAGDGVDRLSFTGFLIACAAKAVEEDPVLHARRWGGRTLVLFDEVDANVQLEETRSDGERIVQSRLLRAANTKTIAEISAEIRQAQAVTDVDRRRYAGTRWFVAVPRPLRTLVWRSVLSNPWAAKRFGGTIAVSSVGMFGTNLGWGIPIAPVPLMLTVGGIGPRLVLVDGAVREREHLSLTISVDHDIIDGAPAARFTQRLRELISQGHGLPDTATAAASTCRPGR